MLRIATWNASLNRESAGELRRDLLAGHPQVTAFAAVVRRVAPDILFVNEFDYDPTGATPRLLQRRYLPEFRHHFARESNTGLPTGLDLDNNGRIGGPEDAYGFGRFPGQFGMLLLSRWPLEVASARTFQKFLWRDMPGAAWPDRADTPEPGDWYTDEEKSRLRLSSKGHWDLPVRVGRQRLHLLLSHPTPPAFDGAEDRNGRRNHDEIRLWADYLTGGERAAYLYDDRGRRGGLAVAAPFVLLGDMNADPVDGDSYGRAIHQLLEHPRIHPEAHGRWAPASTGAQSAAATQGGANARQRGDRRLDTADFSDGTVGNLRIDYVLPSRGLAVCGSGVFWPAPDHPDAALFGGPAGAISDHRLVWMDIALSGRCPADYRSRSSMPTGQ